MARCSGVGSRCQEGKSSTERALALIALAEPAFRDELRAAAKTMHLI